MSSWQKNQMCWFSIFLAESANKSSLLKVHSQNLINRKVFLKRWSPLSCGLEGRALPRARFTHTCIITCGWSGHLFEPQPLVFSFTHSMAIRQYFMFKMIILWLMHEYISILCNAYSIPSPFWPPPSNLLVWYCPCLISYGKEGKRERKKKEKKRKSHFP